MLIMKWPRLIAMLPSTLVKAIKLRTIDQWIFFFGGLNASADGKALH